jgi:hypothetical protein
MVIFGTVGPGMNGSIGICIDGDLLPPLPPLPLSGGAVLPDPVKMISLIWDHFPTRLRATSIRPIHRTALCWPLITLL